MGRRELNLKHAILKASVTHTGGDVPVTAGYNIWNSGESSWIRIPLEIRSISVVAEAI